MTFHSSEQQLTKLHATLMEPSGRTMVWRAQQFAGLPEGFAAPNVTPDASNLVAEVNAGDDLPLIKLGPRRRGGQPVIQGRNVRAATIAELIAAGEDPGDVADWYELTEQEVAQAVGYTAALPRVA